MKSSKISLGILLSALLFVIFACGGAPAQDPLKVAPDMYRLLTENDRVRVMEVTFQPGQAIATHSHPDHLAYFLTGGTLNITANGKTNELTANAGDPVWISAETHSAVNTGTTEVKILVVELKEPAPKK